MKRIVITLAILFTSLLCLLFIAISNAVEDEKIEQILSDLTSSKEGRKVLFEMMKSNITQNSSPEDYRELMCENGAYCQPKRRKSVKFMEAVHLLTRIKYCKFLTPYKIALTLSKLLKETECSRCKYLMNDSFWDDQNYCCGLSKEKRTTTKSGSRKKLSFKFDATNFGCLCICILFVAFLNLCKPLIKYKLERYEKDQSFSSFPSSNPNRSSVFKNYSIITGKSYDQVLTGSVNESEFTIKQGESHDEDVKISDFPESQVGRDHQSFKDTMSMEEKLQIAQSAESKVRFDMIDSLITSNIKDEDEEESDKPQSLLFKDEEIKADPSEFCPEPNMNFESLPNPDDNNANTIDLDHDEIKFDESELRRWTTS